MLHLSLVLALKGHDWTLGSAGQCSPSHFSSVALIVALAFVNSSFSALTSFGSALTASKGPPAEGSAVAFSRAFSRSRILPCKRSVRAVWLLMISF
jgi:hypothetical protein